MYSSQRYTKSVATQKMWKSFQTWNCRKKYKYQGGLWSQLWCNLSWYFKGIWFFNTQVCVLSHSVVFNSATLSTVAHQAPLSMEFSRQEYWSGLPCLPPGDLPNPGIEPRRKWQPTPALLPGKFHGQRSLVGYSPWGCKELDMTEHKESKRLHFT